MPTLREMADLAASLKNKIQQNKLRMRRAGVSPDIPMEMLQALEILEKTLSQAEYLDELVEATEDGPAVPMASESPASLNLPSELLKRLALGIQSSVESALEPWQSQLANSTAQFGHFVNELQHSIKAFAQAEGDYAERAAIVEQQRKQLAEQLEKSLSLQWRFSRQRKTLAQSIRAQRAEMQLESSKAKAELDKRLAESLDEEWAKAEGELDQLRKELEKAEKRIVQLQSSAKDATSQLELHIKEQNHQLQTSLYEVELLRNQLADAKETAANASSTDHNLLAQLAQLEKQFADSQEQLVRSTNQISEKDSQLKDKDNLLRQVHRQFSEKEQQVSDQSARLDEAMTRIQLLQSALDACSDDSEQENIVDGSNWKPKWEEAQAELTDLREQNSELAARIAQLTTDSLSTRTGRGTVNPELLSWEERKKLMLQQLEQDTTSDDLAESAVDQQHRLDIQDVIATTHGEIERRNREIEELREIIQLQSEARQGMAIGAAGVAQLFENNDLINEERKKLQDIQQEWEAKLRQAEIDLSMERAKLARERSELELAQLKRSSAQALNAGQSQGEKQQRRWKNFLGLKEESSD